MTKEAYDKVFRLCCEYYNEETLLHAISVENYVEKDIRYMLMTCEQQFAVRAVALAHDLFEDTDCDCFRLINACGNADDRAEILIAVCLLTRMSDEHYDQYIKKIITSNKLYAIIVKEADLKDHLIRKSTLPESLEKRYRRAAKMFLDAYN